MLRDRDSKRQRDRGGERGRSPQIAKTKHSGSHLSVFYCDHLHSIVKIWHDVVLGNDEPAHGLCGGNLRRRSVSSPLLARHSCRRKENFEAGLSILVGSTCAPSFWERKSTKHKQISGIILIGWVANFVCVFLGHYLWEKNTHNIPRKSPNNPAKVLFMCCSVRLFSALPILRDVVYRSYGAVFVGLCWSIHVTSSTCPSH